MHIPVLSQNGKAILVFSKNDIEPIFEITLTLIERTQDSLVFELSGCSKPENISMDLAAESDLFYASYHDQVTAMTADIGSPPEILGPVKIQWSLTENA